MSDWPKNISKPPLPDGYEFIHLGQAIGLPKPHPWWIRVVWKMRNGNTRCLRIGGYFPTPITAIIAARKKVKEHAEMRKRKNDTE